MNVQKVSMEGRAKQAKRTKVEVERKKWSPFFHGVTYIKKLSKSQSVFPKKLKGSRVSKKLGKSITYTFEDLTFIWYLLVPGIFC